MSCPFTLPLREMTSHTRGKTLLIAILHGKKNKTRTIDERLYAPAALELRSVAEQEQRTNEMRNAF
jgi:hypothetical protein